MNNQTYYSPKHFSQRHPSFPEGGLRHLIFHEHENGLAESGAIVRVGRKVLINEQKFFSWLEQQSAEGGSHGGKK